MPLTRSCCSTYPPPPCSACTWNPRSVDTCVQPSASSLIRFCCERGQRCFLLRCCWSELTKLTYLLLTRKPGFLRSLAGHLPGRSIVCGLPGGPRGSEEEGPTAAPSTGDQSPKIDVQQDQRVPSGERRLLGCTKRRPPAGAEGAAKTPAPGRLAVQFQFVFVGSQSRFTATKTHNTLAQTPQASFDAARSAAVSRSSRHTMDDEYAFLEAAVDGKAPPSEAAAPAPREGEGGGAGDKPRDSSRSRDRERGEKSERSKEKRRHRRCGERGRAV
jgi:hypothetical protein